MFISNTEKDRKEMLDAIGVSSFKELIKQGPGELLNPGYELPPALNEMELAAHIKELGSKNGRFLNFAGAGAYEHFIPAAVKYLASRGEFVTAYTPYQAEASQGTLQTIYEYQSSICSLLEMDVSNASLYDGATALAEAVNAALQITSKNNVLIPEALHPHYKAVLRTYFKANAPVNFIEISCSGGVMDQADLDSRLDSSAACVVIASPNFYGCIEDVDSVSKKARESQALIIAVANPISLGVLRTPGSYDADFAVAEGQSLGMALSYGGPYLGIFTCKNQHIRHVPGRICGMTKDAGGKRAFVLTLQAREQHIRREKAASNICSNEALCALYATIYLALMGPQGLKEAAEANLEAAHIAAEKISALPGYSLKFDRPFFNEFAVQCPVDASIIRDRLLSDGILAGVALGEFNPGMKNCLLVCVTETKSIQDVEKLAAALRKHSNG